MRWICSLYVVQAWRCRHLAVSQPPLPPNGRHATIALVSSRHEQASSLVIWFVYVPALLILAGAVMRLVPAFLGKRTHGIIAAISMVLAAVSIAFTVSSGWVLQARYHLLSNTPAYFRLALDGLSIITSLALLLGAAWTALARGHGQASIGWSDWCVLSVTLLVLAAANPLTLLIGWSAFALMRVVISSRDADEPSGLVMGAELASLATLLAATYGLGLEGLSAPFFPIRPQGYQGWLVAISALLRMGLLPPWLDDRSPSNLHLASALTGLYLLLRTVEALPALAIAAALLGLGSAIMAALSVTADHDTDQSWGWLLQHTLFVGVLAAALGSGSKLAGLGALVCIAWCARIAMRGEEQPASAWVLVGTASLGGIAPSLGWAAWTASLDALSSLRAPWIMAAVGLGFALCAWTLGHKLRTATGTRPMWWRDLFRWQDLWQGIPALLLVGLGIRSSLLTYHGRGPLWVAVGSQAGLLSEAGIWPMGAGIAALTSASLALGWLWREGAGRESRVLHRWNPKAALRSTVAGLERARTALVQIDITLREHAVLAWTALAAVALVLWLYGR
jgi:hypothetical protein